MTFGVDLAIVGSGFGGALLAMVAARLGLRVVLLERGTHPRFAIGESASPLASVVLEQIADRYELPRLTPLTSYGRWRRAYPAVTCGLKRGFTYFHHEVARPYRRRPDRSNELLVAASPTDELSDTHWFRAEVDHFLVREAVALGADYVDRLQLDALDWNVAGEPVLSGVRSGERVRIEARSIVDATGPRGFLSRALDLGAPGFDAFPGTQALYSHFTGVARCGDMPEFGVADADAHGTLPYPMDAAALHHVFDGGWMWVLRFDNGVTSAGVAVTDACASELGLADGEPAWTRLLARFPSIAAQFAGATAVRAFTWMPRVSYRAGAAAGPRWALLPSAAAFVDPLFSSGIPMTLMGIERLAHALEGWAGRPRSAAPDWGDYEAVTLAEADHTARFVAGCYAAFPRFDDFAAYSMFYFAAASFSEMTRRVGGASRGFLCGADREFAAAVAHLSPALGSCHDRARRIAAAVDRVNIAGLCDPAKRNWYAADLEDAVRGASKLGVSEWRVRRSLPYPLLPLST